MNMIVRSSILAMVLLIGAATPAWGLPVFTGADVFELEWITDIDVAANGDRILYVRAGYDIMTDGTRTTLWVIDADGANAKPLIADAGSISGPQFSPQGDRIAFIASTDAGARLRMLWLASGETTTVAQLAAPPQSLAFSADGKQLAFLMRVAEKPEPFVAPDEPPKGATWAAQPKVIERLLYRGDGSGYAEPGETQVFVVPSDGGTPRQLTSGGHPHFGTPVWAEDGRAIVVAGNHRADWEYESADSSLYRIDVATGETRALTDRYGPEYAPKLSPDGRQLAYLGYDDDRRSNIDAAVYLMDLASGNTRRLSPPLEGGVDDVRFARDGKRLFVQYDAEGDTRIASLNLAGRITDHIEGAGGLDLTRPYSGAQFDLGADVLAYTKASATRPADLAVWRGRGEPRQLTHVNDDLLGGRELGAIEEIWFESPADGARIQGWIVKPPGFDAGKRYPMVLEIHGGPHTNYGARFAAEIQLYAAAGYVVVYANPRGSTSYGEAFANKIDKNYPSQDYDDLMGAVDAVVAKGYIDTRNLFVTGGSGGGALTAWIVGKTNRFRAAASAKPVINWTSFMLTSDIGSMIDDRWFADAPWLNTAEYLRRSPLSLVGSVSTPTMLITGENDYRTPISESEQYYQALKIRGVDTMLVRVADASHDISARPSQLISKVAHILAWFERYRVKD